MSKSRSAVQRAGASEWVQPLLEVGPLVVFFVANWRADIYWATAWFMVAVSISVAASWFIRRRLPMLPLFTLGFVMVFGALTLWLQDKTFIMVRPTITNLMFALILWGGLAFGKPLLKYALDMVIRMSDEGWRVLTVRWSFFFVLLAILNEIVWRNFSADFWVAFKVFGIFPLTMAFAASQLPILTRHALPQDQEQGLDDGR